MTRQYAALGKSERVLQGGTVMPNRLLQGSEAKYHAVIDTAVDAIVIIDESGRILSFNRAAERIFGYAASETLGQNVKMLMPDPDRGRHDAYLANYRRTGEAHIIGIGREVVGLRKDGSTFPLDLSIAEWRSEGERYFTGMMRDITERKTAEEQRRSDEAKYRAVIDTAVDAIVIIDEFGAVRSFNRSAEAMFGYVAADIVGKNVRMLMPEPFRGEHDHYLANYRKTGQRKIIGIGREVVGRRSDGSTFPLDLSIAEWRDQDARYFTGIMRDVSDRKAAEAELRRLNETLEQRVAERTREVEAANRRLTAQMANLQRAQTALQEAQKMEAVGQLTGGIAHDFNNLLTAIAGSLDLVYDRCEGDARSRRLIDSANRAVERGSQLTSQLLAFARKQTLRPKLARPDELLKEFWLLIDRSAGESVQAELKARPDLWAVSLDPAQFQSAILNLVVNARDAMPGGGRLVVEARNAKMRDAEMIHDMIAGEYVLVEVSDTGGGMTPEVQKRAFEPFFTTKEVGKGTGLGLSQVYGFVRQSGGFADIVSEVGHGTTVRLFLPRTEDVPARDAKPVESASALEQDRAPLATVLLVEDDPAVREMSLNILQEAGYRVLVAEVAQQALDILSRGERVDVLFTDVVMPGGMNGIELARTVAKLRPDVRLLLTTGYVGASLEMDDIEFPLLRKPYRRADVAARLQEIIAAD